MQQSSGEDQFAQQAEQTINFFHQHNPYFWRLHNPEELAKLKEELIQGAMEAAGLSRREPQETEGKGFLSRQADDEFWNDRTALEEAGRMVRPKKL